MVFPYWLCSIYYLIVLKSCKSNEISAVVGQNVTIKCISNSSNPVWWTFNSNNITTISSDKFLPTVTKLDDNETKFEETSGLVFTHSLTILNIVIKDEGNFTCLSLHPNRTLNSYLIKPLIKPIVVDSSSKAINIHMGKTLILFCLIKVFPTENVARALKWTKDSINLDGSVYKEYVQIVNGTHINTTLEIKQAFKKDNGTYACIIALNYTLKREISILLLDIPHVSIDYVKAVGANRIFLNWTVNDGNDAVQKYFIQYMQEGTPTFTYYNHVIDGKNTSFTLENFHPNTNYQIRMSAKNSIGDGPINSYNQWVRTLDKDPTFTPQVETTGSSSSTITIGWQAPPSNIVEYIQYYELIIFELTDNTRKIVEEAIYQQNSRNLPYMFDNLKTATIYEFQVRACSDLTKICGPWSEIVNGTTMDGMASEPSELKVICSHFNMSMRNSVSIKWEYPKIPNGKVISYLIQLDGVAVYRSQGKYITEALGPKVRSVDEPNRKTVYEGVPSNTNYTITVSGKTRNKKIGETATASCSMPATVPNNIDRIDWNNIKTSDNKNVFRIFMPKISERNGEICCYRIFLVRIKNQNKDLPMPENSVIASYGEVYKINNTNGGTYLAEMFSGNYYKHEIFLGDSRRIFNDEESQLKSDEICRKCFNGSLESNDQQIKKKRVNTFTTLKETVTEDGQYNPDQLQQVGVRTFLSQSFNSKHIRRNVEVNGNVQTFNSITNSESNNYSTFTYVPYEAFDGEIDIESNYTGFLQIIVRNNLRNVNDNFVLSTYSNYFDVLSPKAAMDKFDSADNFMQILNIVAQVLCALLLLVLLLLIALCFMHHYYRKGHEPGNEVINLRDSLSRAFCGGRTSNHRHIIGSALSKPTDVGPLSKSDLPHEYIIRHKDTDYGFLREYEMLPSRFNDRTTKNSDAKENAYKNRYPDIKAYDQTRVKLSLMNSVPGTDYINANFVIGYKERKKFICSQGPMEVTINDFWRMTWEQHLEIIVMLTNLEEYNKSKCAKYWPEKITESQRFGDISVMFAAEHRYSDYLVRHLDISKKYSTLNEGEHRHITQYHYLVWKDFMAPEHPYGIIKFIRQINSDYSVQRGPILVHCSAGVGRTGTFVALDSLMQQLEDEGQVSIFNTVCDLRHQRNYLVQSLKQYIFLYRALLDISQFENTELPIKFLSSTIENLKQNSTESKEKCKLELQFDKINMITDETNKTSLVGSGIENMSKNRSELVIPYDCNRVILTPIPSRENSTYINASFIDGYGISDSFIITQDPLEKTIGDFWRMLSEQGISTLVMISEIGDGLQRKCPRYWADDEIQYDHILIKYLHSEICPYYTRREFSVTNCKNDDTIKVTQFQYNGWPTVEGEVPEVCRGIIELVDQAQKHHKSERNSGSESPIVVHCRLGTDRSSIFIAMCILVKQLRTEKKIDICTVTRKMISQRTLLINDYAQYEFLHRAIANYADLHQLSENMLPGCT